MRPNKNAYIFLAIVTVIALLVIIVHDRNNDNLRENLILTEGRFIDFYRGVKTGGGTKFSFSVNGTTYYGRGESPSVECQRMLNSRKNELKQINFPVIYESGNPENAEILIFQSQYDYFGIDIPMEIFDLVLKISNC